MRRESVKIGDCILRHAVNPVSRNQQSEPSARKAFGSSLRPTSCAPAGCAGAHRGTRHQARAKRVPVEGGQNGLLVLYEDVKPRGLMIFNALSMRADLIRLSLLAMVSSCSASEAPNTASTGGSSQSGGAAAGCEDKRTAFTDALSEESSCETDDDCGFYQAPCVAVESRNCAGIFYINASAREAIDTLKKDYESCLSRSCDAGGVCGLGPHAPKCVDQKCQ